MISLVCLILPLYCINGCYKWEWLYLVRYPRQEKEKKIDSSGFEAKEKGIHFGDVFKFSISVIVFFIIKEIVLKRLNESFTILNLHCALSDRAVTWFWARLEVHLYDENCILLLLK